VLRIYDAEKIELVREQAAHQAAVTALLAAPGDNSVVSGGDDGVVHVWNPLSLERLRSFYPNRSPIVGLAFSNDGARIAVATERYGGWVWKFDDASKPIHTGATSMRPLGVAFTANGGELVTIGDRRLLFRSAITARRPAAGNTTQQYTPPVYWAWRSRRTGSTSPHPWPKGSGIGIPQQGCCGMYFRSTARSRTPWRSRPTAAGWPRGGWGSRFGI
jgi:WD40 repeat protein